MAQVKRITKSESIIAAKYECGECGHAFHYDGGFPEYCPDCGVEFLVTEDET